MIHLLTFLGLLYCVLYPPLLLIVEKPFFKKESWPMKCKKDSISVPLKSDKVCIHIFFQSKEKSISDREVIKNVFMAQNISTCFLISKTMEENTMICLKFLKFSLNLFFSRKLNINSFSNIIDI